MNIVIIPSWFPTKGDQINGSFFLEQAKALARFGHNVVVLNVSYVGRKDYFRLSNFIVTDSFVDKVRVVSWTTPGFFISRRKNPRYYMFSLKLFKVFKKLNLSDWCDIIHCHSYLPAGYFGTKLGKKYNIPVVLTEHASSLNMKDNIVNKYMLEHVIKFANGVISVGDELSNSIRELTKTNREIHIVPNLVSSVFSFHKNELSELFKFVSIGSLIKRKNHELSIKSFKMFANKYPNSSLCIIGEGPEKESLLKLINELNLDNVKLLGALNREDTYNELCNSNAFVLASKKETFGVVYAEALIVGRPVISRKNGGAEYIVNDSNGIVIDSDNVENFFKAMEDIYINYSKYNQSKISYDAQSKYSERVISNNITSIYERIVNEDEKKKHL